MSASDFEYQILFGFCRWRVRSVALFQKLLRIVGKAVVVKQDCAENARAVSVLVVAHTESEKLNSIIKRLQVVISVPDFAIWMDWEGLSRDRNRYQKKGDDGFHI